MIAQPSFDPATVARYRAAGAWRDDTLFDCVARVASANPHRTAVIDGSGRSTYRDTVEQTVRAMAALSGLGVARGDVVAVQLPPVREFVPIVLAVEQLGAIVCPAIPNLPERTLSAVLQLGRPRAVISVAEYGRARPAQTACRLRESLPELGVTQIAVVGDDVPYGASPWSALLESTGGSYRPPRPPGANDLAELAFTSGTTGEPKGAMHTHNTSLSGVRSTIARQRIQPSDVVHLALPVGHNFGYVYGVRLALAAGATLVLQRRWDPDEMLDLVERHGVTVSSGTPTHLVDLLALHASWRGRLASLRVYTCAGAKLAPHEAEQALARLPGRLSRAFGMTEIGHVTATGPESPATKAITTEGSPQPEVTVAVRGDDGAPLGPGEVGELSFGGPFLFAGYVQGPSVTASAMTADGFFRTGDFGYLDEDGYMVVTGRGKEIIVRGGEKIPIIEIENALRAHAEVADIAVVGVPDPRLGERTVACVKPRPGARPSLSDLQRLLETNGLGRLYWPESCVLVDEVPRNALGKVLRQRLVADVAAEAQRQWRDAADGA